MEHAVVTGGAGFIGSHLVGRLAQDDIKTTILDNLSSGNLHNIEPFLSDKITFIEADILDKAALHGAFKDADTVFHLAAKTSVPESMIDPVAYTHTNAVGTLQVIQAAQEAGVKHIVISSTAAVYGDNPIVPKVESMIPEPKSPYAVSKLDAEHFARIYNRPGECDIACLRYFNVFGPRQDPNSAYAAAIPTFIDQALKGESLIIFGEEEKTRDFISVDDVVEANILAVGHSDVYNVANQEPITIEWLAQQIVALTHSHSPITYGPSRPGDIQHSYADNSKICNQLGFKPQRDFAQALAQTIQACQNKSNS
jgi:UDP-glucose 4-epimerase